MLGLANRLFARLPVCAQVPAFFLRICVCAVIPMTPLGGRRVWRAKATFFCPRSNQATDEQCRYEKNGNPEFFWHRKAHPGPSHDVLDGGLSLPRTQDRPHQAVAGYPRPLRRAVLTRRAKRDCRLARRTVTPAGPDTKRIDTREKTAGCFITRAPHALGAACRVAALGADWIS